MRAVLYLRQSKDATGEGHAVQRQEVETTKLCTQRGWTVTEVVIDNDISASTKKKRPGFERVLKMAERGELDAIVCYHVDRLTRSLRDLERVIEICLENDVKLITVSGDLDLSTDAGRLNARILAAVARAEVERKGARQKLANEQRAKAGKPLGWTHRPFGFEKNDRTQHVLEEAEAIREACYVIQTGGSLRGIVRDWTRKGFVPPQRPEGDWTPQTVRAILLNPRIAGKATYGGEVVGEGTWQPIVAEATWRAVKAILDSPTRQTPKGVQTLLSGLATCACGRPVWAGRTHHSRQNYKCSSYFAGLAGEGSDVKHTSRGSDHVNNFVRDLVVARLSAPDARDLLLRSDVEDAEELQAKLLVLQNRLDELAEMFAEGEIGRAQLTTGSAKVRDEVASIEAKLADAGRVDVLGDLVRVQDVLKVWNRLDLDRQRAVINILMSVTLHPVGQGSRTFKPETVEITWK